MKSEKGEVKKTGVSEKIQKSKCKMQNCGGPSGGFLLKKRKCEPKVEMRIREIGGFERESTDKNVNL
ncbi:MAG: hypothetical protein ACYS67_05860 [Planctomycetota bacterium]